MHAIGVISSYASWLPVSSATPVITLGEGNTPLLEARGLLPPEFRLWLKWEGANPTGSFKDRGMTLAVSKACEAGARAMVCASTGNTAASAAAYAARAGARAVVVVPQDAVARGKLAQARIYGARIVRVRGNFDAALAAVRQFTSQHPTVALVNSVNPYRLAGQKTAAFEVVDALGHAPDYLALPVGNAGNISAYWRGFVEYHEAGLAATRPHLLGFQAAGAAPLATGAAVDHPETLASAIRIGRPASGHLARQAVAESEGAFYAVTDAEMLAAQGRLARATGIIAELASAAPLAGVLRLAESGELRPGTEVVVVLTGHGLKDPDVLELHGGADEDSISVEAVAEALEQEARR